VALGVIRHCGRLMFCRLPLYAFLLAATAATTRILPELAALSTGLVWPCPQPDSTISTGNTSIPCPAKFCVLPAIYGQKMYFRCIQQSSRYPPMPGTSHWLALLRPAKGLNFG